ncbi:MAG: PAS domain S-box protein, partial [Proteobacteria bacterium]|nr:PAS domain S-box protein [Pseudomonadota bacterium]
KKDGTIFPVEISTSMFTLRNRKVLCGVVRDITERKQAEEALRLERDNLRNIFESIEDGIYIVNQQYDIQYVNPVLVKDFGSYEGIKCYKYFHDRDEICTWCKNQDVFAGKTVHWEWYSFKNERTFDLIDTPMTLPDGTIGKLEIFRDITERKRAEDLVRNLSQMLMQAQERERQMISCELHDSIAQNLAKLKIDCKLIFDDQPAIFHELKVKMEKYSNLIDQTITAVRNLSYDLRPPALDEMGIVKALEIYCEEFSENSGLKVDFQSAGVHKLIFDSNAEIHLYRLVQEGLNNIRKHAHATRATIKLVGASPNIILRIEDDGKGFDVKARELALDKEKRLGIRSMRERVNLLGGQMTIHSRLMEGTKIFITYPIHIKNV